MLNFKRESLEWWQGRTYWFTNLLSDWLLIHAIYFGADLVGQGVEERVEIRFQLFFSFPWIQIFKVKTYWNRWVTIKPIIPILLQSCNGQIFLRCLTEQEIIQQSMKEMQNANMSFAFFGLEAQGCTLQGLFTYGFREVCLNKQFKSWGPALPGDHSVMWGKLALSQLVNRHFSWACKQMWSDSSWSVLAHTSFYQAAASLRCKFHSSDQIHFRSRLAYVHCVMIQNPGLGLREERERRVMTLCFPASFPCFSQE